MLEFVFIVLAITCLICFIGMIVTTVIDQIEITGLFVIGAVLSLLALCTVGIIVSVQNDDRLMNQCIADGKKEYECHAMIKSYQRVAPVPIVIPRAH